MKAVENTLADQDFHLPRDQWDAGIPYQPGRPGERWSRHQGGVWTYRSPPTQDWTVRVPAGSAS